MANAYLYTRKSRHLGDPDDPNLLAAHIATLKRLAAADGITVPESRIRTEIGSGESIAGRPIFQQLLQEWEALPPGAGGIVYVIATSRLSRGSNQERGRILDALIRARIIVTCPERRYDPTNPTEELTWNVVQSVDRAEVQRYKQLVAIRRSEMTRNGEVTTGTECYGYRWIKSPGHREGRPIPGHLEADASEFPILVRLCREILTVSMARLEARYGLSHGVLQRTLNNPVICGYPARRWSRSRAEWLWPEQPGQYPAACSRAEWEAIQAVLAERRRYRLKTGSVAADGWCRPVVQFPDCPGPVKLSSHNHTLIYRRERPGTPLLYIHREAVHTAAVAALSALWRCPGVLAQALHLVEREREAQVTARSVGSLDTVRRQLERERERYARLKEEGADPALTDAEEREALARAERACRLRLEELKTQLAALARDPGSLPDLTHLLGQFADLEADFAGAWALLPGEERLDVVGALLEAIPVTVTAGRAGTRFLREVGTPTHPFWLRRAFG